MMGGKASSPPPAKIATKPYATMSQQNPFPAAPAPHSIGDSVEVGMRGKSGFQAMVAPPPSLQDKCFTVVTTLPLLEDGPNEDWQFIYHCTVGQWSALPRAVQVHRYVKRRTLRRLLRLWSTATRDAITTPSLRPPVGDSPPTSPQRQGPSRATPVSLKNSFGALAGLDNVAPVQEVAGPLPTPSKLFDGFGNDAAPAIEAATSPKKEGPQSESPDIPPPLPLPLASAVETTARRANPPAPTLPSPPPPPPHTSRTSCALRPPPFQPRSARPPRRTPSHRCKVWYCTTPDRWWGESGILGDTPYTPNHLPSPSPSPFPSPPSSPPPDTPARNQAWSPLPPYTPPFAPSHAPLYAPGGATDVSPCLIQAWVGSWVCTAWAWPCSGGWFVPSLPVG